MINWSKVKRCSFFFNNNEELAEIVEYLKKEGFIISQGIKAQLESNGSGYTAIAHDAGGSVRFSGDVQGGSNKQDFSHIFTVADIRLINLEIL